MLLLQSFRRFAVSRIHRHRNILRNILVVNNEALVIVNTNVYTNGLFVKWRDRSIRFRLAEEGVGRL